MRPGRRASTFLFLIDPIENLKPGHDTSVALMEQAQDGGHRVLVATMRDLGVRDGRATVVCHEARIRAATLIRGHWHVEEDWFSLGGPERHVLDNLDAVFVRSDPPVDRDYLRATYLLDLVDQRETLVINGPGGLRNANEKIFALRFPDLCPPSLVSSDPVEIIEATTHWGVAVLKPTDGMAGRGVMLLRPDDPNIHSLLEVATERGRRHVVAQRFLPESHDGDRRVIVLAGEPIGVVRRVAAPGEFRCNMAAGAAVVADVVTVADRTLCARIAPKLLEYGLIFVGLDVIGDQLIEINVTSPTGVREIDAFSGERLGARVIRWVERQMDASTDSSQT